METNPEIKLRNYLEAVILVFWQWKQAARKIIQNVHMVSGDNQE